MPPFEIDDAFKVLHHPRSTELNVLSLNDAGIMLAGMHDGSTLLWDSSEERTLLSIQFPRAVTAGIWLTRSDGTVSGFAVGCSNGKFYLYGQKGNGWDRHFEYPGSEEGAIECFAWHPDTRHLAIGAASGAKVFKVDERTHARLLDFASPRPATVRFVAFASQGKELLIGYLETHELCSYRLAPLTLQWSAFLPTRIGHAVIAGDDKYLIVYNLSTGIDLYEMPVVPGAGPSQSFPMGSNLHKLSLVGSAREGEIIVCGGPDGRMAVVNQSTGRRVASLPVGSTSTFLQVVAARTIEDRTILAAGCKVDGQITIKVWECARKEKVSSALIFAAGWLNCLQAQPVAGENQSIVRQIFSFIVRSFVALFVFFLIFAGCAAGTALYHVLLQTGAERLLEAVFAN
ncbi:hypothetical protein MD484_g8682, partial [Candolleomyces efflorescens]